MSSIKLIGREEEVVILNKAIQSKEAELVAVIGRRRVGKTFLIRTIYAKRIRFEMTGIQNGTLQRANTTFYQSLKFSPKTNHPI